MTRRSGGPSGPTEGASTNDANRVPPRRRVRAWLGSSRGRAACETAGVGLAAGLLFLPLLSVQYNPNAVNEAINVEIGGSSLFSPNHLAYRPVGSVIWNAARWFGYSGRSLPVLQILSALSGVLAAMFAFVAFRRLTGRTWPAAIGVGFLATSSYFWASCVDAFYIAPAAALAAAAIAVVTVSAPTGRVVAAAAVLTSAAVLVWQANVFLILPIAAVLVAASTGLDLQTRLLRAVAYSAGTVAITGSWYVVVAVVVFRRRSAAAVLDWFSNYAGARLPQWGTWNGDRVTDLLKTGIDSLIPVRAVGGIKGLLETAGGIDSAAIAVSIAALAVLALVAVRALLDCGSYRAWLSSFGWLGLGYLGFLPFLLWWDPFEPRWFVVPNLFLAGLVAAMLAGGDGNRKLRLAATVCVVLLASSNLVVSIWPQHTEQSLRQRRAACVGGHLNSRDCFVATDWRWNAYLTYFHDVRVISTIGFAARLDGPDAIIDEIVQRVAAVRAAGGHAYMVDPDYYPGWHLVWLESQTGLTKSMLEGLGGEPVFTCEGVPLLRLGDPPQ